jgi:hypothetical protein
MNKKINFKTNEGSERHPNKIKMTNKYFKDAQHH